ncbi:major allergen Pru ar 1 [Corchorus olitorius]|uniref:Major allergen Pru ar 1 n=1 Tax=Corchorus olitorius TaxID=93759 RepID=A0A1R3HMX0_9ROSI|nr:major allergen Pru ar 1 [Corchorus olitorius]
MGVFTYESEVVTTIPPAKIVLHGVQYIQGNGDLEKEANSAQGRGTRQKKFCLWL